MERGQEEEEAGEGEGAGGIRWRERAESVGGSTLTSFTYVKPKLSKAFQRMVIVII